MISLKKFINKANQNIDDKEIDEFLNLMNDTFIHQQYLTKRSFQIFKSFLEYVQALSKNNLDVLNNTQQKIINKFNSFNKPITYSSSSEEGGTTLKYQPNGFISALLVISFCLSFGLLIAYLFIRTI